MAPRSRPPRADTQGSASARRPVHRASRPRGCSATAAKPERAASGGGPVLSPSAARSAAQGHAGKNLPPSNRQVDDAHVALPPGVRVLGVGVDTISYMFRKDRDDDEFWLRLRVAEDQKLLSGFDVARYERRGTAAVKELRRGSYRLAEPLLNATWGWWSRRGVYVEGRLGAMNPLDAVTPLTLGSPWTVVHWSRICSALWSYLFCPLELSPIGTIRRADLCVDLAFDSEAESERFMVALSRLCLPGFKQDTWVSAGRVETVYQRSPRGRVRWRAYVKSVQASLPTPPVVIRLEHQLSWNRADQPDADKITPQQLADLWLGELAPWADAADDVRVAGPCAAQEAIIAAAERGEITAQRAESLLGYVALRSAGQGRSFFRKVSRAHIPARRERELRDLGIILDPASLTTDFTVPLGSILKAARLAWAAQTNSPTRGKAGATQHPRTPTKPTPPVLASSP